MNPIITLLLALTVLCRAAPANLGLSFDKRAGALPTLKLPYATYRAASYNPNGDVCPFLHSSIVLVSNLPYRSIPSRTFASPPHQSGISDGPNQRHRRPRQKFKMDLTGPSASKPRSKDLN